MKIATIVRGYLPVPRPKDMLYAPLDIAVTIAQGLAAKGHNVDFYAPKGSKPGVPVKTLGIEPLVRNKKEWEHHLADIKPHLHYFSWFWEYPFVESMFERAAKGEYDLLYFHHPELPLTFAKRYPSVTAVSTLHDPLFDWYQQLFRMYQAPNHHLVSISDNQRKASTVPFTKTIYNGIDVNQFAFSDKPGEYLLFAGRIVPEKGVAEAVQLARQTGERLLIVGLLFPKDKPYFNRHIKPFLNDQIQYVGYVEREKLAPYYQKAKAMLMPVQWDEPFGLSMIESMATGTPVIALSRGSIPEVVVDGITGYVVDSLPEMTQAIKRIDKLDRPACRQHVEKFFSNQAMVASYEALFTKLATKQ